MSKLKEMKTEKEKKGFDFTYLFLGLAALLVIIIIYFAFFGDPPEPIQGDLEDDDPFRGPENAKVTVVEFSDFECPACGSMHPVMTQLFLEYKDQVKFVFRDFPLISIHPYAQKAAEASQCAFKQGKFWEYHDILFENQNALTINDLKKYAQELGLDSTVFNKCLEEGEFAMEVSRDASDAQQIGVKGTPTYFVNNVQYSSMSINQFKEIIEKELK